MITTSKFLKTPNTSSENVQNVKNIIQIWQISNEVVKQAAKES